jgi:hypothetical protein
MRKGNIWTACGLLVVLSAVGPKVARAAEFDGSVPFLCAVMAVMECDRRGGCEHVEPAVAGLPPFLRVDVGKKTLEATDGSGRKSDIHSSSRDKERLVLHGGEHGRAWSVVISHKTGDMAAAIIDHDGGFLVSGACTLL